MSTASQLALFVQPPPGSSRPRSPKLALFDAIGHAAQLALFVRTAGPPLVTDGFLPIGFVWRAGLSRPPANWLCLYNRPPVAKLSEIGFV
jgi:hypothetical protein